MRVAIYARVSKVDQKLDSQLHELRQSCQNRGFEIIKEFTDIGVSGSKDKRPGLNALMNAARKRHIDAIMVYRFDRFARSTSHLAIALDEFNALGVQFISHSENLDTTTPMGKAMYAIIGAMAQLERDILIERVNSGIAAAKAKGKHCGRPWKHSKLTEQIKKMRLDGESYGSIAKLLGIPKSSVVDHCKL